MDASLIAFAGQLNVKRLKKWFFLEILAQEVRGGLFQLGSDVVVSQFSFERFIIKSFIFELLKRFTHIEESILCKFGIKGNRIFF